LKQDLIPLKSPPLPHSLYCYTPPSYHSLVSILLINRYTQRGTQKWRSRRSINIFLLLFQKFSLATSIQSELITSRTFDLSFDEFVIVDREDTCILKDLRTQMLEIGICFLFLVFVGVAVCIPEERFPSTGLGGARPKSPM
jgi:hypothetical protein